MTEALLALAARIDAALPQTQCTRCGYPDCADYAHAIAYDSAPINQCPPGGMEGVARLADITARDIIPLNPANGVESPRAVAFIDEDWCIGCTLCVDACPTDAIVGANKKMHTVIEQYCTGCELCIPVCPVDCIALENATGDKTGWDAWTEPLAQQARQRYQLRRERLVRSEGSTVCGDLTSGLDSTTSPESAKSGSPTPDATDPRKAAIAAAMERARLRKLQAPGMG